MKRIQMILQGKGGVGKSFVASLLAQRMMSRGTVPVCIDTDPVNQTFAGYTAFGARKLQLMRDGNIDPRGFDQLIEMVMSEPDETAFIIDNGAATFVPLCAYLFENDVAGFLTGSGIELVLHSVLTGGQALGDTMDGLASLLKLFPNIPVVVWLNEFFGRVERDGKAFEDSRLYKDNRDKIQALLRIPEVRKETFGTDLDQMLRQKLTFSAIREAPDFSIMAKQRLAMTWRALDSQMAGAGL
ncbi:conjugal transfer protein TraL [Ferrovibrio sp.]|uniref:conjugal transfer protein TraL n=1 Tax=Ferrovibrio sp. TaxID=1917215 RepID=UPI00311D443E